MSTRALPLAVLWACTGTPPIDPCDAGLCQPPKVMSCDAGAFLAIDGGCVAAGWTQCPQGFTPDGTGWACVPIVSAAACPAGTMPQIGERGCVAVGWTQCPTGFVPADAGWGCAPLLPASACAGATREAVGSETCAPIGDCGDAGFPPAAATLFVDDSYTAGQLDATHFRSISAAMATAAPGVTIAIESGSYREPLAPNRPLKLIGRCPARVEVSNDAGQPGLAVLGPFDLEIEGMTLRDSTLGVRAESGARITGRKLVIEANRRSGVQAVDSNTSVSLDDAVVRGTLVDASTQTFGQGIAASYAARLTLSDVAITGNRETGIFLDRTGTRADCTRVVIAGTQARASTGRLGWGVGVQGGAEMSLQSSVISDNQATGALVSQAQSRITLVDSIIRGTRAGKDNTGMDIGFGAAAQLGGRLELTGGAVLDAPQTLIDIQPGATVVLARVLLSGVSATLRPARAIQNADGTLTLTDVAIVGLASPGVETFGARGRATLDRVGFVELDGPAVRAQESGVVTGTRVSAVRASTAAFVSSQQGSLALTDCFAADTHHGTDPIEGPASPGAFVQLGGTMTLERCALERSSGVGVYVNAGSISLRSSVIRATGFDADGGFGQGAVVEYGGSLGLEEVLVEGNRTAGLQAGFPGSSLLAVRTVVRDTQPDATGKRGRGANVQAGATITAIGSAFLGNRQVGIFAFGGRAVLNDTIVLGTKADADGAYGNGVEALTDGDIALSGGAIEGSAGIGAVFAEGSGLLDAVRVLNNTVGIHVQDGAMLLEVPAAPDQRGPRDVAVTKSTQFEGNATRVGAGQIPVPAL